MKERGRDRLAVWVLFMFEQDEADEGVGVT